MTNCGESLGLFGERIPHNFVTYFTKFRQNIPKTKKDQPTGKPFISKSIFYAFWAAKCGAGVRSRTADLLITSEMLYQLSYTSSV